MRGVDRLPESTGTLTVVTTIGRGTMPIPGARVTVTPQDQAAQPQTDVTNENGRTRVFVLPAPPAFESQTPEQPHPYAVYTVFVETANFHPVDAIGVAVFAGVDATLPVDLVPRLGTGQIQAEVFPPQVLDRR
ncbi:MAG: hypothetical protein IJ452_08645 [Butyricicoccus sp.]|nr:hypothetical protein [Butyricicoccus sp.]